MDDQADRAMKDEDGDLLLDDTMFLESLATGFEAVKIKPRGNTASEIQHATAGTKQFRDRAQRLRLIASRFRHLQSLMASLQTRGSE